MRSVGIVLIVAGIVMMLFTGFTYITKKNIIDIGPVEVNKEEKHPVQWSPIAGGILVIGGIVLVMNGKRRA